MEERPLPDGTQMWNVTTLPGPAVGDDTTTVPLPVPATLTASDRAPAKARVVDVAAPESGAPEIAQPWTLASKLYCDVSLPVAPPAPAAPPPPLVPPAPVVPPPVERETLPAFKIAPAR